ncbi:MAG: lytic transglycosylase domain-containing protein [Aliidongia sp.]
MTGTEVGSGRCLYEPARRDRRLRPIGAAAILLTLLSACSSSGPAHHVAPAPVVSAEQQREYAPPGPPEDPWGPYIREASQRFDFPDGWIRAVMRQESGGHEYINGQLTTSASGAIGLMQVMPETYAALRDRYGLGPDPYYPRDNIMAGTGYLHELYQRFGSPGFLAAYNAGPQRLSDHLASGRPLPAETVAYVASIGPRIGAGSTVPGGTAPSSAYAAATPSTADALNRQALAAATGRTAPVYQAPAAAPPSSAYAAATPSTADSLNRQVLAAATGRAAPVPAYQAPAAAPPPPPQPRYALAAPAPVAALAPSSSGGWGIQVGAFSNQALATAAAENVRAQAHGQLASARTAVPVTTRPDGVVLYRARLVGISADAANGVCNSLARNQVSCIVVTEDHV